MMAETQSKTQTSTTTITTTTTPTYAPPPKSGISLCLEYFKTGPGIVKLVELFIGIICMACAAPAWTKGTHWFLFVVVTAFVTTSVWCFIYLLNLKSAINLPIDWLLTELLNTAITTLLYLIAVIVQFCSIGPAPQRNIAAGVFGVFNMLTYAVGSFYLYRDWKDSHPHSSFSGSVLKRNP
ncbi:CKLF-like MARVEL transmembrane domain-containing protein 4 [Eriocheir sinensis]|uniref:CKLF-like MARVEL transmembrane domain-containing protein 4 n=1 Tax=Eriocheir sinensis TaxID=95602 RepID=UPI0021C65F9F|nr:CKLF-like MARVEL transmembrane domain-containing protein 4 [Eriocheir sinensis]